MFGYIVILLVFVFVGRSDAFASGFNLKSIGNSETGGRQITKWWYTGSQPAFKGEATPGAEVVVTIDGNAMQINADSSGNWSFTPTEPLTVGGHEVTIASGGSTISFSLSMGTDGVDWNSVESGGAATLPASGTTFPTVLGIGLAMAATIGGAKLYRRM